MLTPLLDVFHALLRLNSSHPPHPHSPRFNGSNGVTMPQLSPPMPQGAAQLGGGLGYFETVAGLHRGEGVNGRAACGGRGKRNVWFDCYWFDC